jgi:hypothetical protein
MVEAVAHTVVKEESVAVADYAGGAAFGQPGFRGGVVAPEEVHWMWVMT